MFLERRDDLSQQPTESGRLGVEMSLRQFTAWVDSCLPKEAAKQEDEKSDG